uniref:Uncharacterized protein AlNc14C247G9576 n=1 Tax=Albugo laibachii Nc14 TaxID=890382 RepID=F0WT91_9STRA|nr:conserved hypothetical protein [Albugo laibachii Nc14]|eukprot:CCA24580.1 conserved hypothetical protein [Albugo laibachii Nc14]
MDINAAFDNIAGWEAQVIAENEQVGKEFGREIGYKEGYSLGCEKGAELGDELGFYHGCYIVWEKMMSSTHEKFRLTPRVPKLICAFGALLESISLEKDEIGGIILQLKFIRAKFKAITAQLRLQHKLLPDGKRPAHEDMSF